MRGDRLPDLIHIPRTAGTALAQALHGAVTRHGHTVTLASLPPDARAIAFLRDPVARFVSAWDFAHDANERNRDGYFRLGYPTAEELALALDPDVMAQEVFRPQVSWVPDLTDARLLFVGRTEHLYRDFLRACDLLGLSGRSLPAYVPPTRSQLSAGAIVSLLGFYREDVELLSWS